MLGKWMLLCLPLMVHAEGLEEVQKMYHTNQDGSLLVITSEPCSIYDEKDNYPFRAYVLDPESNHVEEELCFVIPDAPEGMDPVISVIITDQMIANYRPSAFRKDKDFNGGI